MFEEIKVEKDGEEMTKEELIEKAIKLNGEQQYKYLEKLIKDARQEALADEIEFLKEINHGASYCWMCNQIDKRLLRLKEMKNG